MSVRCDLKQLSLITVQFLLLQFNESWRLLVDWMTEVEQTLDTHKEIALSHEEIKQQLTEQKVCVCYHGEFQLGS